MNRVFVLSILLLFQYGLQAQKKINPAETFEDAYDYLLSNDYAEALYNFQLLNQHGYTNSNIAYLTGFCYLNIPGSEKRAIPLFQQALENISENYREGTYEEIGAPMTAYFYLGQSYRINGEIDKALKTFAELTDRIDTFNNKNAVRLINHELEYLRNARVLMDKPVKFAKTNLGEHINSSANELNPAVTPDESKICYMVEKKFYNAVFENHRINNEWSEKEEITTRIGSDGEFRVVSISADGKKILLYNYEMFNNGEIYESHIEGGKWTKCRKLNNKINTPYAENFASYSPDGKALYFTSNRPGGYGGFDIYRSELGVDGDWTDPVNLGSNVNTPYDEATPFLSGDGMHLYFSSQGHFSMGGYDVFCCRFENGIYGYARNIGYPVNSSGNDLFWVPVKNGEAAYYPVKSQEGLGGFDIWRFEIGPFPDLPRFVIRGKLATSDSALVNSLKFNLALSDLNSHQKEELILSVDNPYFLFNRSSGKYLLEVSSSGYQPEKQEISLDVEQVSSEWVSDVVLRKIIISKRRIFNYRDIFFSFDSQKIGNEYISMIDSIASLMNEFPSIRLEITGYTDYIGAFGYNKWLSLQRAKALMQQIVSKNIDASRISIHGKGAASPLARDKTARGHDIPAGRGWNRRVELIFSDFGSIDIQRIKPPIPIEIRIDM